MPDPQPLTARAIVRNGVTVGWVWLNERSTALPWTACLAGGIQQRFAAEDLAVIWIMEIAARAEEGHPS